MNVNIKANVFAYCIYMNCSVFSKKSLPLFNDVNIPPLSR